MIPVDHLLSARQVASWLGVSEAALTQRRHRGDSPPFVKWGRTVRYVRADVQAWIEDHRRSET